MRCVLNKQILLKLFANLSLSALLALYSPISSASKQESCPESFYPFWKLFRKSIEKDQFKEIKFLTHFPLKIVSGDGKHYKELSPSQFQNIYYKIMGEKCEILDKKNQKQWFIKFKELPSQNSYFTCTKKWVQFCNFDFSFDNKVWRLTKISTTQKELWDTGKQ